MRKTAFIGHREIFAESIGERIIKAIETEIADGCKSFTMGTHGQFDTLALWACRNLRKKYEDLDIEVVLTSLHTLSKYDSLNTSFSDVKTVMYDIEQVHYKRQITLSNRNMIDACDTLICYVDEKAYNSGAKSAMRYAMRNGLKIINLWTEQDKPFYGMTKEEISAHIREIICK